MEPTSELAAAWQRYGERSDAAREILEGNPTFARPDHQGRAYHSLVESQAMAYAWVKAPRDTRILLVQVMSKPFGQPGSACTGNYEYGPWLEGAGEDGAPFDIVLSATEPFHIIGRPRTGTSYLHNLFTADPDNGAVLQWEAMFPVPPPEKATYRTDPRVERAGHTSSSSPTATPSRRSRRW
jgi:hypothetical protein